MDDRCPVCGAPGGSCNFMAKYEESQARRPAGARPEVSEIMARKRKNEVNVTAAGEGELARDESVVVTSFHRAVVSGKVVVLRPGDRLTKAEADALELSTSVPEGPRTAKAPAPARADRPSRGDFATANVNPEGNIESTQPEAAEGTDEAEDHGPGGAPIEDEPHATPDATEAPEASGDPATKGESGPGGVSPKAKK